jgi:FtsZ-interacting cell division protein ZipA
MVVVVIVVVLVALLVIMKWADKRDRANGHINRRMGDLRSTIRDQRRNARVLRSPGGRSAARSPHDIRRGDDRFRR